MDIEEEDDEDAAALKAALAMSEGMDVETVGFLPRTIVQLVHSVYVARGCKKIAGHSECI